MNLESNMKEFHAKAGSATVFDFAKGDPLATTNVNDLHKDAGAQLAFSGSSGKQEQGVTGRFMDGSSSRLRDATANGGWDQKSSAMDNHFSTFDDHFKAFDHRINDAFILLI